MSIIEEILPCRIHSMAQSERNIALLTPPCPNSIGLLTGKWGQSHVVPLRNAFDIRAATHRRQTQPKASWDSLWMANNHANYAFISASPANANNMSI